MGSTSKAAVIAVADASFLIGLGSIGQLGVLPSFADSILIAPTVWDEVVERGSGRPGAVAVQDAAFLEVRAVRGATVARILEAFLDPGEAESLVLAAEVDAKLFFADEAKARRAAQSGGMRTLGVAGLLLAAKQRGLLGEIRPLLQSLRAHGFRLGTQLVEDVLRKAGESPDLG